MTFLYWVVLTIIGTIIISAIIIIWEHYFPSKYEEAYYPENDEDAFFPVMKYSDHLKKRAL